MYKTSLSGGQDQGVKSSLNVCLNDVFGMVDSLVVKHHQHDWECHAKRFLCYLQSQGSIIKI